MKKVVLGVLVSMLLSTMLLAQAAKKAEAKPAGKSTEQTIKDIEAKWAAASLKSDPEAVASLVSDDWTATSPDGKVQTKADMVEMTKKSKLTKSAASDIKVKQLGPDVAVATGIWSGAGTDAEGKKFETSERWTDVFAKKNGEWKAVASQSTTIKK
jgi:uncharacterized protein (TIGR02246 family)